MRKRMNIDVCRTCGSPNLKLYMPLGDHALANSFLKPEDLDKEEKKYPLEVYYCEDCFHSQLGYTVPPEMMFRKYLWVSSTSDAIPVHFAEYAKEVYENFMQPGDLVVEAASNDGCLLKGFKGFDVRILGVEPARNIAEMAEKEGIPTIAEFFDVDIAQKIVKKHGNAAAVIANNVFAHVHDIGGFTDAAYTLLKNNGVFVIESPHFLKLLQNIEFDTVYHEHISYLSLTPLVPFFKKHKMNLYNIKETPVHGGSIRMTVTKDMDKPMTKKLIDLLEQEKKAGISNPKTYEKFQAKIEQLKEDVVKILKDLKVQGKTIAGYGASAKGQTLLQFMNIDTTLLDFIADKAPLKQGLYTPGTHIPIVPAEALLERQPDYTLILAWNFADEIMKQQKEYHIKGGKFIIPIPEPRIV